MYLFSPLRVLYTPHRSLVVVVSYGPAPLLQQLGLDTERIIVPFSSKGVNHMCVPGPMSFTPLYVDCCRFAEFCDIVFRQYRRFNYRPQFQDWQSPHLLISRRAVRRRNYRQIIKSRWKLPGRQWESNSQPSEQLRSMMIKTNALTDSATEAIAMFLTDLTNHRQRIAGRLCKTSNFCSCKPPNLSSIVLVCTGMVPCFLSGSLPSNCTTRLCSNYH